MYRELVNKFIQDHKKKVVEVDGHELGDEIKFYITELNSGEKMHLFWVFDNDLKSASDDEKMLYALNFMLCDKDGDRTEQRDDYSYLCELPYPLLNRLITTVIDVLNISSELKKSAEVISSES